MNINNLWTKGSDSVSKICQSLKKIIWEEVFNSLVKINRINRINKQHIQ